MRIPSRSFLALACLSLASVHAYAADAAAPLGIELGTTTCAAVHDAKGDGWGLKSPGISVWSDGAILSSSNPVIEGLERSRNLLIICDPEDRVIHVSLVIPKDKVQDIAAGLDKKYKSVQRNLPRLGGGYAKWNASNATVVIEYEHVSFDAYLTYQTKKAKTLLDAYSKKEAQRKKNVTNGQL